MASTFWRKRTDSTIAPSLVRPRLTLSLLTILRPYWLNRRLGRTLKVSFWLLLIWLADILLNEWWHAVSPPRHDLDGPFARSCRNPIEVAAQHPREAATFVMLARNEEVEEAVQTITYIEKKFNQWFHYPVLFLNDKEWAPEFVAALNGTVSGEARFEVIPQRKWSFPDWLDPEEAKRQMESQQNSGVLYGGNESYHHMCRFYSGEFYTLEALKPYRWYWRLEPGVQYTCAITYDPFVEMAKRNKIYGYTIALWELSNTCPSLFRAIDEYRLEKKKPANPMWKALIKPSWAPWPLRRLLGRLGWEHRDRNGDSWNLCHYWSNFEIADLDFFRGREYQELFQYLDHTGGFYRERWGDASVHSLALHLLLPPEKLHHFSDVGYRHEPFFQCPGNAPGGQLNKIADVFGKGKYSPEISGRIGCRCECPDGRKRRHKGVCLAALQSPAASHRPTFSQKHWGKYPYSLNLP